ncbi:hypothetical protein [Mucilaginibacter sp. 10I4]|uniref:hypothetical protein n=1 Tax=Mucilaginibacter sp. 10I4 TaxID=3048580 RepID=UPI002B2376FA|nr:hypothetical protein [Mucilaginibacter sp. 10I4]MEB0262908.1 hypothetical protein [Mucilaginibacter sp. 10I4]
MKNFIKGETPLTGSVPLLMDAVIKQWNNRTYITQWNEDYRLREESWRDGKRLEKGIKVTINRVDALYLISKLNLIREQGYFKSSAVYRTAVSEIEMLRIEQEKYDMKKYNFH